MEEPCSLHGSPEEDHKGLGTHASMTCMCGRAPVKLEGKLRRILSQSNLTVASLFLPTMLSHVYAA